jgi:hypothetical protein
MINFNTPDEYMCYFKKIRNDYENLSGGMKIDDFVQ